MLLYSSGAKPAICWGELELPFHSTRHEMRGAVEKCFTVTASSLPLIILKDWGITVDTTEQRFTLYKVYYYFNNMHNN